MFVAQKEDIETASASLRSGLRVLAANRVGLRNPATLAAGVPVGVVPKNLV